MKTIDLADSKLLDDKGPWVFSINDNVGCSLKKSSTMWNLFDEANLSKGNPKSILKKQQKVPNSESMHLIDFISDDRRINTQGSWYSHRSNLISEYWNEVLDHNTNLEEKINFKSSYEFPNGILPSQRKTKNSLVTDKESERSYKNASMSDHQAENKNSKSKLI